MASKFYLHQGKNKKAENGRPWIYIDEINEYDGDYENGDIVEVYNHKNYFIGKGYINDHSKITIRIMTRDINEEIDEEFFKEDLLLHGIIEKLLSIHLLVDLSLEKLTSYQGLQ